MGNVYTCKDEIYTSLGEVANNPTAGATGGGFEEGPSFNPPLNILRKLDLIDYYVYDFNKIAHVVSRDTATALAIYGIVGSGNEIDDETSQEIVSIANEGRDAFDMDNEGVIDSYKTIFNDFEGDDLVNKAGRLAELFIENAWRHKAELGYYVEAAERARYQALASGS